MVTFYNFIYGVLIYNNNFLILKHAVEQDLMRVRSHPFKSL